MADNNADLTGRRAEVPPVGFTRELDFAQLIELFDFSEHPSHAAVLIPWKQAWTFKGFTRGDLLRSIVLAPGEQAPLEVSSWERLTLSFEQSRATDTTAVAETAQDTQDVFKEMMSEPGFAWPIPGGFDGPHSPAVAAIKADGISGMTTFQRTVRDCSEIVKDCTRKAITRVRLRRATRVEQLMEERATRFIRNTNHRHALTLNLFEIFAHYEIALQFMKSSLRLVVPAPPIAESPTQQAFVMNLGNALESAIAETLTPSDTVILPTDHVSVSSQLGKCSGCEECLSPGHYELIKLE